MSNNKSLVIDLSQEKLDIKKLEEVKRDLDKNKYPGDIIWGSSRQAFKSGSTESKLIEEIHALLIRNNEDYQRFPSDYVHALFSRDVYENHAEYEGKIEKYQSTILNEIRKKDTNWRVLDVKEYFNDETLKKKLKVCIYKAVFYVNEPQKQLVVSHKGLDVDFESLFTESGQTNTNISGILLNEMVAQLAICFLVTEEANRLAKENGWNLSFTGYSNGAWLSEYGIYYSHRYFENRNTRAVLFESPGTIKNESDKNSNVISHETDFDLKDLDIINYLTSPTFANSCNKHIGKVYRLFIEEDIESFGDSVEKRITKIPLIGKKLYEQIKNVQFFIEGLYSMFNHRKLESILAYMKQEDKNKELIYKEQVLNWPMIKLSINPNYQENLKNYVEELVDKPAGTIIDFLPIPSFLKKNIVTDTLQKALKKILSNLVDLIAKSICPGLILIINILIEFKEGNIDLNHFQNKKFYQRLIEKRKTETTVEGIMDMFNSEYKTKENDEFQAQLEPRKHLSDYYCLYYLSQGKINNTELSDVVYKCLEKLRKSFSCNVIDERVIIKSKGEKTIRDIKEFFIRIRLVNTRVPSIIDGRYIEKEDKPLISNLPQLEITNFIQRKDIEENLENILSRKEVPVVNGMEGIGKRTLVAHFVSNLQRSFEEVIVLWIQAEDIDNQYIRLLGSQLDLTSEEQIDENKRKERLRDELSRKIMKQADKKFYLILVDVNEFESVEIYLKNIPPNLRVIIITNDFSMVNKSDKRILKNIPLRGFNPKEVRKYLSNNPKIEESNLDTLVENIFADGATEILGVRLELLTSFINKSYRNNLEKILNHLRESDEKIIKKALRKISDDSVVHDMIEFFKIMDLKPIVHIDLLQQLCTLDEEKIDEGIGELEKNSLAKYDHKENGISIHSELRKIITSNFKINEEVSNNSKIFQDIVDVFHVNCKGLEITFLNKKDCEKFRIIYKHIRKIRELLKDHMIKSIKNYKYIYVLEKLCDYEENINLNKSEVLKIKEEILKIKERLFSDDKLDIAVTKNALANVYLDMCDSEKAQKASGLYEESLETIEKINPNNFRDIATLNSNLAKCKEKMKEFSMAKEFQEKALKMRENELPSDHVDIAESLNSLGSIYLKLGKTLEAIDLHKRALDILKKNFTDDNPEIAATLGNIGKAYKDAGDYKSSIDYHLKALDIKRKTLPDDHLELTNSYGNLGSSYENAGLHTEAIYYHTKSLEIRRKILPKNHLKIAISCGKLGEAYRKFGNFEEALKLHKEALEIKKKNLPDNDLDIAVSLGHIANVNVNLGDYENALDGHKKVLEIKRSVYGNVDRREIATSLGNVASLYRDMGRYKKALKFHEEALEMRERIFEKMPGHEEIAISLNNIGSTLRNMGINMDAIERHKEALKIRKKKLEENHPDIGFTNGCVGIVYNNFGCNEDALNYFRKALDISDKNKDIKLDLAITYSYYVIYNNNWGDFEEAIKWYDKSLKVFKNMNFKEDHPDIALLDTYLGCVFYNQGEIERAIKLFEKSLKSFKDRLKEDHPHVATTLSYLGLSLLKKKNYEESLKCFKEVLKIREDKMPKNRFLMASALFQLSIAYRYLNINDKADDCHNDAMKIKQKYLQDFPEKAFAFEKFIYIYIIR